MGTTPKSALAAIEIHRAAVAALGNPHLLREARALVDQRVNALIDRVDALAHLLQVERRRRCCRRCRRGARRFAALTGHGRAFPRGCRHTMRADSTPSMARMLASRSSPSAPSASMSV